MKDLSAALAEGWDDFKAKPSFAVFIVLIYPIIGLLLLRMTAGGAILPLLFPIMAGFALVGPFAAIGIYEISRRRELGLGTSWRHALDVFKGPSIGPIAVLGAMLTGIFIVWLGCAWAIYQWAFNGATFASVASFLDAVFTTSAGWALIVVGNLVGLVFAVAALTLGVVSFPLLLDRPVGFAKALKTSVQVVAANPVVMAAWGLIVAALLVAGSLPFFVGLAIVLPVLGHATWRLYRRAVARGPEISAMGATAAPAI